MTRAIGIADVHAAARRIASFVWRTPMLRSAWLSEKTGAEVWLKLEIVQTTGSYKIRGATNALVSITERQPGVRTIVTASAGNHGQAVAWAAQRLGLHARVHVPATAPRVKKDALRTLGATIIEAADYDEAEQRAAEEAASTDAAFVSAYSHSDVIAGAGTIALEMLADEPSLDTLVAPLGGGGLLSGTAITARAHHDGMRVIGAEAEASPVFTSALAEGRVVDVRVHPTLADGLAGNMEHDSQTFGIVQELVDQVALVAESSIELAMRDLIRRERLVSEGAAATAIGALLQGGLDLKGRHVGVILTGRNVDAEVIKRILT